MWSYTFAIDLVELTAAGAAAASRGVTNTPGCYMRSAREFVTCGTRASKEQGVRVTFIDGLCTRSPARTLPPDPELNRDRSTTASPSPTRPAAYEINWCTARGGVPRDPSRLATRSRSRASRDLGRGPALAIEFSPDTGHPRISHPAGCDRARKRAR